MRIKVHYSKTSVALKGVKLLKAVLIGQRFSDSVSRVNMRKHIMLGIPFRFSVQMMMVSLRRSCEGVIF